MTQTMKFSFLILVLFLVLPLQGRQSTPSGKEISKWTVSDFNLWSKQTEGRKDSLLKGLLSVYSESQYTANDTILLLINYNLSKYYVDRGLIKESRPFTDKTLSQALALKIDTMIFKARLHRFIEYVRLSKFDSAKVVAQVVASDTVDLPKNQISHFHRCLGVLYYYQSDFDNAIRSYLSGLKATPVSDFKQQAQFLINLGACFNRLGDNIKALNYYKKAETICLEQNIRELLAPIYNNKSLIFDKQGDYQSAIKEIEKARKIYKETRNERSIAISNLNIGRNYANFDEQKALKSFNVALTAFKGLDNEYEQVICLHNIGEIYLKWGMYNEAIQRFHESLEIAQKIDNKYQKMYSLDFLSKTYDSLHNHKKALKFHILYSEVKDSIFNTEKQTAIAEIETKYETEKKDNEILQLTNDHQAQEIVINRTRTMQYALTGALIILLLTGAFFWKDRQRKILLAKYRAEEAEKNRIARELHDGLANEVLSISKSLAPDATQIRARLEETDRELRRFAHQLDSKRKFDSTLPDIMNDFIGHGGFGDALEVKVDFFPKLFDLKNAEVKLNLFRIWQELLTNTLKHSKGATSHVQLATMKNKLELTYHDDGTGILSNEKLGGLGMQNIFERINLIKGKYHFDRKRKGFNIRIEIPIKKSQVTYL